MKIKEIYENMSYGPAPESTVEALEYIEQHKGKFSHFINGQWQKPSDEMYFESVNPSNKKVLAQIAEGSEKDVNKAVDAAEKALPTWVGMGGHERAKYLYALARLIQKHSRLFAVLESLDNGKPIRETRDIDIPLVARHFYYHAGWAQLMDTELKDYKEIGVIGQIIPWNFPLLMLSWKIAPALAMGNTVVLKPAEYTSLTALLFADICKQVGLPEGVLNVVTGHGATGEALVNHPKVKKIAFTGSTEVGKIIRRATAGTGKKLSLELGGKSPFIVFEDADLDSVVEGVVDAIWFNQGQVCCAGSRLLVEESVATKLYDKLKVRMENLRLGDALDKSIDMGAIVAPVQVKTIEELVKAGIEEGNAVWQPSWTCPSEGFYFPPTLFTDVSPASIIAREEIFGPVLVAMSFRSPEEAVQLANNTRYGLAASIWTEDINLALDIAPKIKAGTVWINCSNLFDAASGFGGYRESGFGREGGLEGLYEYMVPKIESKYSEKSQYPVGNAKVKSAKGDSMYIDQTSKMYIGGKQVRPDGGNNIDIKNPEGQIVGSVGKGNRKDIRNAVEAAHAAKAWASKPGHHKAQILYFMAENLAQRKHEFSEKLSKLTLRNIKVAEQEVEASIQRLFTYAAYADKYDGHVHNTLHRHVTLAMPESIGVMGVVCSDDFPFLAFISTVIPAITMGNTVIAVPSQTFPTMVTDFYQILETSDLPAGVINIVTGDKDELARELAKHYDVDGLWYFGSKESSKEIETLATDSLKRTWVNHGLHLDWQDSEQGEGKYFLRKSSEIKNIWIPYGV